MIKWRVFVILLIMLAINGIAIEQHLLGTKTERIIEARLWMEDGKMVEASFLVSDPWLAVFTDHNPKSRPYQWIDIKNLTKTGSKSISLGLKDGRVIKADKMYGISSGDRIYFYKMHENSGVERIYVLPLNRREKPTPAYARIRKVEIVAVSEIADPLQYSDYR